MTCAATIASMSFIVGPDSFTCAQDDSQHVHHVLLNDYLRACEADEADALLRALPRLKKELSKQQLVRLVRAIYERVAWLSLHVAELPEAERWEARLARLAKNLYEADLPFAEPDLRAMLQAHRMCHALWYLEPPALVADFAETHELTPELCAALRAFQAAFQAELRETKYTGQAALQVAQQHLHVLLWHDEWDDLDPERCWSEAIRRDYRAMAGERREKWQALLRHIKGNAPAKPARGWNATGEKLIGAVGIDDFRDRMQAWFAPFRCAEPQRLTVAGSHMLRGLLWYCAFARDPVLNHTALALLDAHWKAKRSVDKIMVALVAILETMPAAEAWQPLLRLQRDWGTSSGQIEKLLKKTAAELGIGEQELKERHLPEAGSAGS